MKKIILVCSAILCFTVSNAQEHKISEEIKDNIKARIETGNNPAIVVAYINGDEVDYFSYGKTALKNGVGVDKNSVFEIGSISKVFTTILLSDEVLRGTMKLSDPIANYLPEEVKIPSRNEKTITLKDIATHSSGLPRMPDNFEPENGNNPFSDYSKDRMYSFISNYTLTRDIGERYEYSNYAMGLLGHILSLKNKMSYDDLMIEKIATIYGMNNTGVVITDNMKKHLAKGHAGTQEVENWSFETLAGAGGIKSTAADMVKFIQANMTTENTPINKAMKMSHQLAYKNEAQNFEMGLGWHYSNDIIWHNGGTGGYRAFAGFVKGTQKGVVVLTNSTKSVDDIGLKLLDNSRTLSVPVKEEIQVEAEVPEEVLTTYVGKYELAPAFHVTITKTDAQLFLQATGQQKFPIFPSAQNKFFLKVVKASVTFNKDDTGAVSSMTLHQNGQNVPGKKIE